MMPQPPKTPHWFAALCIVCLLPLVQMPWLISKLPAGADISPLLWIYPFYAVAAAALAWQCYPQRKALAWILIFLLLLSHLAIRYL